MTKFNKLILAGVTIIVMAAIGRTMVVKYSGALVNEVGLAYNNNYPLNLNSYRVDSLSFVSVASSVTFTNQTFTDGSVSTGAITVTTNAGLAAISATDYLTVTGTATPCNVNVTINGVPLYNCVQWYSDPLYTTMTAVGLAQAIRANVPNITVSTGASSTVYTTATVAGVYGNNMTMTTNASSITVNSPVFTGGRDSANLSIGGNFLTFSVLDVASNTAVSIVNSINGNPLLNQSIKASTSGASGTIVTSTAISVGSQFNFVIYSSTQAALTIGGSTVTVTGLGGAGQGQMWGGTNSAYTLVGTSATVITVPNHGFTTALPVLYSTPSAVAIGGLAGGTTYYVIPVSPNSLSLALTSANAQAKTAIVLTSSKTNVTADSFGLAPLAITGTPSYQWQVSNDGMNWSAINTSVNNVTLSSVTLSAFNSTGTVNAWDFGTIGYDWIRLSVVGPTTGAIKLQVYGNGKNTSN